MPGHHDMGGLPAGPIDRSEHELEPWEREVDAVRTLLGDKTRRLLRSDEFRRTVESMDTNDYLRFTYYERWCAAIVRIMDEKGIISEDEFNRRVAALERKGGGAP